MVLSNGATANSMFQLARSDGASGDHWGLRPCRPLGSRRLSLNWGHPDDSPIKSPSPVWPWLSRYSTVARGGYCNFYFRHFKAPV
ncbi:hypothetical protein VTN77DRAFT_9253 [Rasamsonia byssochlamydoides]|uniref:uncharacterized protein n=1 Tax=Rasamsonia byssochlamydoides TaxID=89139 RepID=UPI003743E3AA